MRQEVCLVTKDRLRQIESLVCELEEERERFAREARHHKRIEETYGVAVCLAGTHWTQHGIGCRPLRPSARTSGTRCGSGSTAFPTP